MLAPSLPGARAQQHIVSRTPHDQRDHEDASLPP
jgi:hypothetical protein